MIGIFIITYNGGQFIKKCVDSVVIASKLIKLKEIYVIDDLSTDRTLELIENSYSSITLVKNKVNSGYTYNVNQALKICIKKNINYAFILNQDVVVDKNCFVKLMNSNFLKDSSFVASQPRIMLFRQNELINSLGNGFYYLGFGHCMGKYSFWSNSKERNEIVKINNFSGAIFFLSIRAAEELKYFDENFKYMDDTEFSLRAILKNKKIFLVEDAIAYHDYVFDKKDKIFTINKSRYFLILSYFSIPMIFLLLPALWLLELSFFTLIKQYRKEFKMVYKCFLDPNFWKIVKEKRKQKPKIYFRRHHVKYFDSTMNFSDFGNEILQKTVIPFLSFYWKFIRAFSP